MKKLNSDVVVFFLIVISYMLTRQVIYRLLPPVDSFESWEVRDTYMDIPRTFFGLIALIYGCLRIGKNQMGFVYKGLAITAFLFLFEIGCLIGDGYLRTHYLLTTKELVVLTISSFITGFYEEILFRGLGLAALRSWRGDRFALWTSSLVFLGFHFGVQPSTEWLGIFCFGFLMASLRLVGVSIVWLAICHGLFDSLWFVFDGSGGPSYRWIIYGTLAAIPLAAFYIVKGQRIFGLSKS